MVIKIDRSKCCFQDGKCNACSCKGACKGCVEVCPVGALKREKIISVDKEKCIDCGICIDSCKHGALSLD